MALYSGRATLLMANALEMVQSDKARRTDIKYTSDKKQYGREKRQFVFINFQKLHSVSVGGGGGGGGGCLIKQVAKNGRFQDSHRQHHHTDVFNSNLDTRIKIYRVPYNSL